MNRLQVLLAKATETERVAAEKKAAVLGVTVDNIVGVARMWLCEAMVHPDPFNQSAAEVFSLVEQGHDDGWTGFLADEYLLSGLQVPADSGKPLVTFETAATILNVPVEQLHAIAAFWMLTDPEDSWHGINLRSAWIGGAGLEMFRLELKNGDITPTRPLVEAGRAWIGDCEFPDVDDERLTELTDDEVVDGVEWHYAGGWRAFVRGQLGLA
jgi:hypothetical protein